MKSRFDCRYHVDDGYIGKNRTLYFSIDSFQIKEDMDDEDLIELYNDMMQVDFDESVYPAGENYDEFLDWAKKIRDTKNI